MERSLQPDDHQPDNDDLYRKALPVLRRIAQRIWRQFGSWIELDELISVGLAAVTTAVRRYDPGRCAFVPYVSQRVKWSLLAAVRKRARRRLDRARGIPLGAARNAYDDSARRVQRSGREGGSHSRSVLELRAVDGAGRICSAGDLAEVAVSTLDSPETQLVRRDTERSVRAALAKLSPRQRTLVERHYFDGEMFNTLATDLGISRTAVSRQHRAAIARLALHLRELAPSSD